MNLIYFDNAATTRCYDEVLEKMNYINQNCYGNPVSLHSFGIMAQKELEEARNKIASILSVNNNEVYFTSGATEANNIAVLGISNANKRLGKHIITSKIEHSSVENSINSVL
jgi:cysteine desulfurase